MEHCVVADTDIDVMTAFLVCGPLGRGGVVAMDDLYREYVDYCADRAAVALALDVFAELVRRLMVRLNASRKVH